MSASRSRECAQCSTTTPHNGRRHAILKYLDLLSRRSDLPLVNEKRDAVAYVRVSTDRQAEIGMGLDVQEAAIREWALQGDYQLVDVLREEGVSGTKELDERPALLEA